MNNFMTIFKKDLLEIKRSKKWLIYLISFAAITVFSVISARLLPELLNLMLKGSELDGVFEYRISVADSYMQFISNMGQIGWLIIAIMFSNTLIKEKNNGTYYMLKSNNVSETKIVLSHFLSKLVLISVSYIVALVIFVPLNLILFKEYTGVRGVVALSYLYLSLVFALSLALFISSFVKKNSRGYVLAIIIYFILSILSVFPYIDIYNPLTGLTLATNIITSDSYDIKDYIINILVTLAISVTLVWASIYTFKNKIDNRK